MAGQSHATDRPDQLAALRRLRAAFGPIELIEVISNDPAAAQGEPIREARIADPDRMTPEEHGGAHALLVKAVSTRDWQAARDDLDDLMSKLLVLHRLLEAEERLATASRAPRPSNAPD